MPLCSARQLQGLNLRAALSCEESSKPIVGGSDVLRALLVDEMRRYAECTDHLGLMLSGGIDSLAILSALLDQRHRFITKCTVLTIDRVTDLGDSTANLVAKVLSSLGLEASLRVQSARWLAEEGAMMQTLPRVSRPRLDLEPFVEIGVLSWARELGIDLLVSGFGAERLLSGPNRLAPTRRSPARSGRSHRAVAPKHTKTRFLTPEVAQLTQQWCGILNDAPTDVGRRLFGMPPANGWIDEAWPFCSSMLRSFRFEGSHLDALALESAYLQRKAAIALCVPSNIRRFASPERDTTVRSAVRYWRRYPLTIDALYDAGIVRSGAVPQTIWEAASSHAAISWIQG